MKIAISIPNELFLNVKELSEKLNISRSQFITIAIKEYIEKQKNRQLLDTLNKAYSNIDTSEEIKLKKKTKEYYHRLCEEEKW